MASKKKLFSNTKALVMGLGLHGGGVATSQWLIKNGAQVTATDMRTKQQLAPSLAKLRNTTMQFVLGEHRAQDFINNDMIVVNPGVPRESTYLAIAKEHGKRLENDASLFFSQIKNPVIAITGTRGKTTTTAWVAQLLRTKNKLVRASGNTPENALLKEFDRVNGKNIPVVAELSSWQCEYLPMAKSAPHIAAITNLYPDHLNRYNGMKDYANAKANIFRNQNASDFLILNRENEWTPFFAKKKHAARLLYVSTKILPKRYDGIFIHEHHAIIRFNNKEHTLMSLTKFRHLYGEHNLENLLMALLCVFLHDQKHVVDERDILKLSTPHMRQEIIFQKHNLVVVNDSCATSPDGTTAAIKRFVKQGEVVLITGGTDKDLEFGEFVQFLSETIPHQQLVLLEGSATTKLIATANKIKYETSIPNQTLEECVQDAIAIAGKLNNPILVFSPGAASFEKFLHEFDRGEQFNKLVKKYI